MLRPTERFTTRVENYAKYRPSYPPEVLEILTRECGLLPSWAIADIGSGTGILTKLLLENGNPALGVEPNEAMRKAAEASLSGHPNFTSIDGTAEETTLPDACVELVAAAQAFHWFDRAKAKQEFRRILKPGGWVLLIWNERKRDGSPFMQAYEQLLHRFAPDYKKVTQRRIDGPALTEFFSPAGYQDRRLANFRGADLAGFQGDVLSASYAPEAGQAGHEEMLAEIERIFEEHQRDGQVLMEFDTRVYVGQLRGQE